MARLSEVLALYRYEDAPPKFLRYFPGLKGGWLLYVPPAIERDAQDFIEIIVKQLSSHPGLAPVAHKVDKRTDADLYFFAFEGEEDPE